MLLDLFVLFQETLQSVVADAVVDAVVVFERSKH